MKGLCDMSQKVEKSGQNFHTDTVVVFDLCDIVLSW